VERSKRRLLVSRKHVVIEELEQNEKWTFGHENISELEQRLILAFIHIEPIVSE
jgi:hypothetical protein